MTDTIFAPAGTDHAIVTMALGVAFAEPLPPAAMELFRSPIDELTADLPKHLVFEGQVFTMQIGPGGPSPANAGASTGIEKVEFQRFSNGGQLEWGLAIEKNRVVVVCHAYTRWADVAGRAFRHLDVILRSLQPHRTVASAAVLETTDEFFQLQVDSERPFVGLLRKDCPWLAPHVLESASLFHNHVGWFEAAPPTDGRLLVRLNIDALPPTQFERAPRGALAGLRIGTFLRADPGTEPFPLAIGQGSILVDRFEAMHLRNKELVSRLLTDKMKDRIGLS